MIRAALLAAFALALPTAAAAQRACDFSPELDALSLGRVVKGDDGARLHFSRDADGQPCAEPRCRAKAFVVTGDEVVVGFRDGAYACVWYKPKGRQVSFGTLGWVRADALAAVPVAAAPSAADWSGTWVRDRRLGLENSVTIRPAGPGKLKVTGDAAYAIDAAAIERGGVNVGELDDVVAVRGRQAGAFLPGPNGRRPSLDFKPEEFECHFGMQLVGDWLFVADNNACGGHNVSFFGLYRRDR